MALVTAIVVLAAKFWILDPLYSALGTLLAWFYSVVPSFGVAIVLLTMAVRLLTFPLTAKQARSQQEMQRLQPEMKRLQAKYKGDKQKLNEEMMKFYKENHVNPFSSCLPLFVQAPVLIVLYRLILGLTNKPPKHLPTSSAMYAALQESGGKMVSWGMNLARRASDVTGPQRIPFVILILLVGATGFYQQRQLTARLPKESLNSQMAVMGKVFPLVFVVISWSIPAGVVVYFLVSNIWQIGQQAFMFRNQPRPDAGTKDAAGWKKPTQTKPSAPKARTKAPPTGSGKRGKGTTTGRLAKGARPSKTSLGSGKNGSGTGRGAGRGAPPKGRKKTGSGPKTKPSAPTAARSKNGGGGDPGRSAKTKNDQASKKAGAAGGMEAKTGSEAKVGDASRGEPLKPGPSGSEVAQAEAGASPAPEPAPSTGPSSSITDGQGSNGSGPLTTPLPPNAGDLDKDGE